MSQNWKTKHINTSHKHRGGSARGVRVQRVTQPRHRSHSWRSVFKWLSGAVVLIGVVYILVHTLPRVEVTIIPLMRTIESEEVVVLSTLPDARAENTIPASRISTRGEIGATFAATGTKDAGEHARGSATFINATGLTHELLVEDGLQTIDGVTLTVTHPLFIPPASVSADGDVVPGSIQADIVALEPGENGNITQQKIFINSVSPDKQHKIYAQVDTPLTGGTSKVVTVISQEDIDIAQERLVEILSENLREEMRQKLKKGTLLLNETFQLEEREFQSDIAINEERADFGYRLRAQAFAIAVEESVLTQTLTERAQGMLKPHEALLFNAPQNTEYRSVVRAADGTIELTIFTQWYVSTPIDTERVKESIFGLREADVRRELLEDPAITDVRFDWNFALIHRIPTVPSHVRIKLGL